MEFASFDPLEFKNAAASDAALAALKREIENILSSYVGWYDPFCELIQNSLDAVEARVDMENSVNPFNEYKPLIRVIINLDDNSLTVTDNGIGLDVNKFQQFLAPNFSFKTGNTRGHKGVGATYVAYGFNYMRICTKVPGFSASGRIVNARNWIKSHAVGANPRVEPDVSVYTDSKFYEIDRGVSITVRFDIDTHPKRLDWIRANNAEKWSKILSIKTGIGSVIADNSKLIVIRVICAGVETEEILNGTSYFWLHKSASKVVSVRDLKKAEKDCFRKYGLANKISDKYKNLQYIFETWRFEEIIDFYGEHLDEDDKEIINKHKPLIGMEFGYTARLWSDFNERLELRNGYKVLTSGIQLAANNMPQGEILLIPLNRNIGRQNQLHYLIHFEDYTPDLGRKGFHRELTDFAKKIARIITESTMSKLRQYLKPNTGTAPDLVREMRISDWKKEMVEHEEKSPLFLTNEHFFKPVQRVSITSVPTREQDVIALFHQLIAGGVIRGVIVMSTNERFIYDGLFKISFDLEKNLYIYDQNKNPLGVSEEVAGDLHGNIIGPKILEYKYCLDGLIEDLDNQEKNIKDLDLCVVWSTGDLYKERYSMISLLLSENTNQRQYHGVTHIMCDLDSGARCCDVIVLEELIGCLNDSHGCVNVQRSKYE